MLVNDESEEIYKYHFKGKATWPEQHYRENHNNTNLHLHVHVEG